MNRFRTLITAAAAALTSQQPPIPCMRRSRSPWVARRQRAPTDTSILHPIAARPTATTARSGSRAVYSLALAVVSRPRDFHGSVNNHFDPNHGYHGRRWRAARGRPTP